MKHPDLWKAVTNNNLGSNICFICACRLTKRNRTQEDVYPKWLQRRFRLTNETLLLLNGSTIPYRQLKVPCCRECNGTHLQRIERAMSKAVLQGADAVRQLGDRDLFIWLGKIFYGTLYRELSLKRDRKASTKGVIFRKDQLKKFWSHRMFLRSAYLPMAFNGFFPSSILVLKTQEPDDPQLKWDYSDDLNAMFVGCRMGKVGIVCTLQDGQAVKSHFPNLLKSALSLDLHPLQFSEVMARVRYLGILLNRSPHYVTLFDGRHVSVTQTNVRRYSNRPLFNRWNQLEYSSLLSRMTGMPRENLFSPPNKVWTSLTTTSGKPQRMPLKRFPVKTVFRVRPQNNQGQA